MKEKCHPVQNVEKNTEGKPEKENNKILVMEGNSSLRTLFGDMLEYFGYSCELSRNGFETIDIYSEAVKKKDDFDVVILDLNNKYGMSGKDVFTFLQEINPNVKAIITSGYSGDPIMTNFRLFGFVGALKKPFTIAQFKNMLKKQCDKDINISDMF